MITTVKPLQGHQVSPRTEHSGHICTYIHTNGHFGAYNTQRFYVYTLRLESVRSTLQHLICTPICTRILQRDVGGIALASAVYFAPLLSLPLWYGSNVHGGMCGPSMLLFLCLRRYNLCTSLHVPFSPCTLSMYPLSAPSLVISLLPVPHVVHYPIHGGYREARSLFSCTSFSSASCVCAEYFFLRTSFCASIRRANPSSQSLPVRRIYLHSRASLCILSPNLFPNLFPSLFPNLSPCLCFLYVSGATLCHSVSVVS